MTKGENGELKKKNNEGDVSSVLAHHESKDWRLAILACIVCIH